MVTIIWASGDVFTVGGACEKHVYETQYGEVQ